MPSLSRRHARREKSQHTMTQAITDVISDVTWETVHFDITNIMSNHQYFPNAFAILGKGGTYPCHPGKPQVRVTSLLMSAVMSLEKLRIVTFWCYVKSSIQIHHQWKYSMHCDLCHLLLPLPVTPWLPIDEIKPTLHKGTGGHCMGCRGGGGGPILQSLTIVSISPSRPTPKPCSSALP